VVEEEAESGLTASIPGPKISPANPMVASTSPMISIFNKTGLKSPHHPAQDRTASRQHIYKVTSGHFVSLFFYSGADPGCLSRIPDPNFSIPDHTDQKDSGSRIRICIK
jgi:hypothetical protein